MNELLSICIPTFSRSSYLSELLESIGKEIEIQPWIKEYIKVYVSDNASTDLTFDVCKKFQLKYANLYYSRNDYNIGGDENIFKCFNTGTGKYRWVVGDDELIEPGGLAHIIKILEREEPGLFINNDGKYKSRLKLPRSYKNFRDFAKATIRAGNPHTLIGHTLTTANVFLSKCFDSDLAMAKLHTRYCRYSHMYGLVSGLVKTKLSVFVTNKTTIHIREKRVPPVCTKNPERARDLTEDWIEYLGWLKNQVDLPTLNIDRALSYSETDESKLKRLFISSIRYTLPDSISNIIIDILIQVKKTINRAKIICKS